MIYTLIGSRETPEDILELMTKFAYKAASKNYTVRSGGAGGADTCAEKGVKMYLRDNNLGSYLQETLMEIYLPWNNFNGRDSDEDGYYTLSNMMCKKEAYDLASQTHPAWERCSNGAKSLHARNTMQILGSDLETPSRFILCYGKSEKEGSVIPKGGTRTACVLGQQHGVEIFNLYLTEHRERVEEWVK